MRTQSDTSRCGPALLGDSRDDASLPPGSRIPGVLTFGGLPWLISRAGLRDYGLRATAERRGHRHAADARKETFFAGHAEAERERAAGGCDESGDCRVRAPERAEKDAETAAHSGRNKPRVGQRAVHKMYRLPALCQLQRPDEDGDQ